MRRFCEIIIGIPFFKAQLHSELHSVDSLMRENFNSKSGETLSGKQIWKTIWESVCKEMSNIMMPIWATFIDKRTNQIQFGKVFS